LNIKDEQIEQSKRKKTENISEKYRQKIKLMEKHYESKIEELLNQIKIYKKPFHSRQGIQSEETKYSRSAKRSINKTNEPYLPHNNYMGTSDIECTNQDDIDWDTDITPAEEMNTLDRLHMIEKTENLNNESLLISFYKNKIVDKQAHVNPPKKNAKINNYSKQSLTHNYTHRASGPLKTRDENVDHEAHLYQSNSMYAQVNSQRQVSGYVPKHYQIPKKEKSVNMDTQGTTGTDISESLKKLQMNNAR